MPPVLLQGSAASSQMLPELLKVYLFGKPQESRTALDAEEQRQLQQYLKNRRV